MAVTTHALRDFREHRERTNGYSPVSVEDEVSVVVRHVRFVLSRDALERASSVFMQLFLMHEKAKHGELTIDLDPEHFQNLLDVYNSYYNITPDIIDPVFSMAERLRFQVVSEACKKFVAEDLPSMSIMHALRLADKYKLTVIKQKLFDSISIDVFRSLNSDVNYKMMDAQLKAELLDKWGTFL